MKRRPVKIFRKTPPDVLKEVCLRAGGRWLNNACFGGKCEICKGKKMDARGLKFMHQKRRKMGGTTSLAIHSPENVKRACYPCDEENDGVRLPKSKPVDRPLMLSGYHGTTGKPWTREMQAGIKQKKEK